MDYTDRIKPEILSRDITNDGKYVLVRIRKGRKIYVEKQPLNPLDYPDDVEVGAW